MKWLEIIEVRSTKHNGDISASIHKMLANFRNAPCWSIYRHGSFATDTSIHLLHTSGKPNRVGSDLGLQLGAALQEFGLVHHTVWIGVGFSQ